MKQSVNVKIGYPTPNVLANFKVIGWIVGLTLINGYLLYTLYLSHPGFLLDFIRQFIIANLLPFSLVGIGIGLPAVLFAFILGWLQIILIIHGLIPPHLAKEGFFQILNSLIKGFVNGN